MIKIKMPCGLEIESDIDKSAPGICGDCHKKCEYRMAPPVPNITNLKWAEEQKKYCKKEE